MPSWIDAWEIIVSGKEEIMGQFSENKVQILVSTTVVEVGVNVPNATVMVIYDAERFGLSRHQLRGRVGRGSEQSYCLLIADPKSETGKERMRIMTETNDGFVLSEKDLELRVEISLGVSKVAYQNLRLLTWYMIIER